MSDIKNLSPEQIEKSKDLKNIEIGYFDGPVNAKKPEKEVTNASVESVEMEDDGGYDLE